MDKIYWHMNAKQGSAKVHMNTDLSDAIVVRTSQTRRFTTSTWQLLHNCRTMSFLNECMSDNDSRNTSWPGVNLVANRTSEAGNIYK